MVDGSTSYDRWVESHGDDWGEDEHYLNYPGLLYTFYYKVKPMFKYIDDFKKTIMDRFEN